MTDEINQTINEASNGSLASSMGDPYESVSDEIIEEVQDKIGRVAIVVADEKRYKTNVTHLFEELSFIDKKLIEHLIVKRFLDRLLIDWTKDKEIDENDR